MKPDQEMGQLVSLDLSARDRRQSHQGQHGHFEHPRLGLAEGSRLVLVDQARDPAGEQQLTDVPVEAETVRIRQGRHERGHHRQAEPRHVAAASLIPGARDRFTASGCRHDDGQGHEASVQVGQDHREERHPGDHPAPALVLFLADTQGQVDKRDREDVGPDQEVDAADRGHEHGNDDRHNGCDPVANQARRQRRVNARQQDRRECHGGRPAGMIHQQGKQDVEGPRLVNPGGAGSREGQRVGVRHGSPTRGCRGPDAGARACPDR